jgi:hypothetical protein
MLGHQRAELLICILNFCVVSKLLEAMRTSLEVVDNNVDLLIRRFLRCPTSSISKSLYRRNLSDSITILIGFLKSTSPVMNTAGHAKFLTEFHMFGIKVNKSIDTPDTY